MESEGIVIGGLAVVMGVVLFCMRSEMLEFAREGGRGLRNRRVIAAVVAVAIAFLLAAGTAVELTSVM